MLITTILEQGDQSNLHLYTSSKSVCYYARDMHACYMPIFLLFIVFPAFPVENSKSGRRGDSWHGCFLPPNPHCKDMPPSSYSSKKTYVRAHRESIAKTVSDHRS